jgi:hypothetical protein
VEAHCPASGVKVYAYVPTKELLTTGGFQIPVIPLDEVVGKYGLIESN